MARTPDGVPPIRGLMALRAIAENGTFTGAAQALGWNQPSVSKHLQALEKTLGTRLLRRNRAGSLLTPEGAVVLEHAIRITEAYQDLLAALPAVPHPEDAEGIPVRIAASPTLGQHWLPQVLPDLRTAVPDATITVRVARGREALRHVARGHADLALVEHTPAEDDLVAERIGSDRLMAACHTSHPWADRDGLTLQEFLEAPKVLREPGSDLREALDRHLRTAGMPPIAPEREAGSSTTLMDQLRKGEHLTVTSSLALDGDDHAGLAALPIRDADLTRQLWAARPASGDPEPSLSQLLDHLRRRASSEERAG